MTSGRLPPETVRLTIDVPRSALITVAAPPEFISQHTVEPAVGVPARSYLEDIGSPSYGAEVIKRGKLRLTRRVDYINYVRRRSLERATAEAGASDGADGVLADLGLRVVRGGK